jgi:hypothetical protein
MQPSQLLLLDHAVADLDPPVRHLGEVAVVCYDNEGLVEVFPELKKKVVKFHCIF